MPNTKRSLAAAIALTTMTSSMAFAKDAAFSQVIAFGDSLTDVGNYDVFTNGGDDREVAISLLSQNLGLGAVTPSCGGMESAFCLPNVDPTLSQEELEASVTAQIAAGMRNGGTGWAVGGHKAADVLMNIIGSDNYAAFLQANGLEADPSRHNLLSALMPTTGDEGLTPSYPDSQLLGQLLGQQAAAAQLVAQAEAAAAEGDMVTYGNLMAQAAAVGADIEQTFTDIIISAGTSGNPHPLGMGYLESTLGSTDQNALYWVNGGGNDLLSGFSEVAAGSATIEEITTDLDIASTMLASAAGALSGAGAKYILVSNVPDISKTPGVYAAAYEAVYSSDDAATLQAAVAAGLMTEDEATAQLTAAIDSVLLEANEASEGFNSALLSKAKDIDGVLMVDQAGILKVALNNPTLLGLSAEFDQSQFCYDGSGNDCIEHPVYGIEGTDPDADKLIFNDSVHPTQVGQEVLADYYTAIVNAAQVAGQLPDMAIQASRSHTNSLDESLASVRYRSAQTGVFAGTSIGNLDYDTDYTANVRGDGYSNILGLTYALRDNAEIGFAVSRSNLDVDNSQLAIDSTSTNYSLFGRMHYDIFFVESNVTLTDVDYDEVSRNLTLGDTYSGNLTGNTSGQNLSVGITAGANLLNSDTFQFGPFVSVTKVSTDVDGYTEDAIEGLTYTGSNEIELDPIGMHYGDQDRHLRNMRFGAFANKSWDTINAYAEIWYEDTNGTEEDTVEVGVKSMEGNMNDMPSYASVDEGIFNGGMGMIAGIRWQAADTIAVSATLASRPTTESASINLTYRF
ncbi:autotransporter domain-containing protein [Microbulbifer sp. OS29]|uniref:Autotransporter domain-containing protein n=1 Tax=Microbulbifer okhotskensis TaxID=2926617 RepID=A0A9X2EPI1_9GAMM|nr:autotransporter domain-containing protein [Microbulbifer okhotskensis]MCO1336049.1 autotransporter domain-containing protein [Microbulbifer okhotskensis]